MPTIRRTALVEHSSSRMFALVSDVRSYPQRFDWCDGATVIDESEDCIVARLDLRAAGLKTWFVTENRMSPPHHIELQLVEGPFRRLKGRWEFHALDESACRVTLLLDFEPASRLLAPAFVLGFQTLADRMVDDFVRAADRG